MVPTRRATIRLLAAGTAATAGCSGADDPTPAAGGDTDEPTATPTGTSTQTTRPTATRYRMPRDAVMATEPDGATTTDGTPVRVAALPDAERRIAVTAVEDEVYRTCDPQPAIQSLAGRFADRKTVHLALDGRRYAAWLRILDEVYATGAPSPGTTDCRNNEL